MCSRPGPRSSRRMKQSPSTISVVVAAVRPSSSEPPKTLSTMKNESSEPTAIPSPGGHRERGQRAQQPAAVQRALARRQGEDEGRDPDRQHRGDGELAGQEGKGEAEDRREQDQEPGVDGLGQVEAPEAVDVAGDPPALGDGPRQHRELVAEQDDVGDPLGDLASGAHRDGEPGLLQRRDVVDAVADHRREAPAIGERADQRLLLLRRDPAEDRVVLRGAARARPCPSGRSGPSITPASPGTPTAWATAVTVWRASPEISFRSTCWWRMNSIVSAASGRSCSSSTTRARGSSLGGGWLPGSAGSAADDSPKATTRRPAAVCSSERALQLGRQLERPGLGEHVGRPEHVAAGRSAAVQGDAAPLPLRGERHLGDHPLAARRGSARRSSPGSGCAPRPSAAKRPSASCATAGCALVGHLDRDQVEGAVGERSGLVDADRVHGGQRLGRGHLLDEGVHPRQADGRDGEGDAHQQHQALGDQRHEAGGRRLSRLVERHVADRERDQQQHGERHHHDRGRAQHAVDLDLERRGRVAERPGLAGDLLRVAVARGPRRPRSSPSPRGRRRPRASGRHRACGPRRTRR